MTVTRIDRAALVRRALVELVAERGFRGTSMAAVAERAGVATGTAYVHYASKDDLVLAAHKELKHDLGLAGSRVELAGGPAARFRLRWLAFYRHLASDPVRARFLGQVAAAMHDVMDSDEATELVEVVGPDMVELFVGLPMSVAYDLSMGPIVRLVSSGESRARDELDLPAATCWRAATRVPRRLRRLATHPGRLSGCVCRDQ